jgi:hypothetical protein
VALVVLWVVLPLAVGHSNSMPSSDHGHDASAATHDGPPSPNQTSSPPDTGSTTPGPRT